MDVFVASVLISILRAFNERISLPLMRWCAEKKIPIPERPLPGTYIEGDTRINVAVMRAALKDHDDARSTDPDKVQAVLNACLESLRHESISQPMLTMFGTLIAQGYQPDEAMYRICANMVDLGMYLERRLTKAN